MNSFTNEELRIIVQGYLNAPTNGWQGYCSAAVVVPDGRTAVSIVGIGALATITRHAPKVRDEIIKKYVATPLAEVLSDATGAPHKAENLIIRVVDYNAH